MEKTTSEVDSLSEQGEIDSKVNNMSTLDKSFVPDIVITNDDPELSQRITTKASINTQQQSPYNGGPGDKFERQTSLELDTTVIREKQEFQRNKNFKFMLLLHEIPK